MVGRGTDLLRPSLPRRWAQARATSSRPPKGRRQTSLLARESVREVSQLKSRAAGDARGNGPAATVASDAVGSAGGGEDDRAASFAELDFKGSSSDFSARIGSLLSARSLRTFDSNERRTSCDNGLGGGRLGSCCVLSGGLARARQGCCCKRYRTARGSAP